MKRVFVFVLFIVLIIVVVVFIMYFLSDRIDLVAQGDINVEAEMRNDVKTADVVVILHSQERMPVTACHDVKSYIIPEVDAGNGRKGYVIVGRYKLVRV